jgi:gliding motility-associated-like protein
MPRLMASVNGATYAWQDGSTQADFSVNTDGIYWLDITVDGCSARDSVAVNYIILPEMILGEDRTLCEGEQVNYDVTYPGATYNWQDGATTPTYTVTTSGDYAVAISIEQCSVSDEVSLIFNPTPSFTLPNDTLLCQGDNLNLTINAFADEYRWSNGSTGPSVNVSYPGGTIWGETDLDGCTYRDEIVVSFQDPPLVDLGQDTLLCEDYSVMLSAGVQADSYLWQDGSTSSSIESSGSGLYSVEVTDGPCVVTDSVFVGTRPCVYFEVYVPNAFSPNGDGINDVLRPMISSQVQITSYSFKVYDRWGTEVFTSANLDDGWDGMLKSLPLPMGVYIYFVQFEYMDDRGGGSDLLTGDIMLMR